MCLIQHRLPSRLNMQNLQVFRQVGFSVEIVAVVNKDFHVGIEAIDQVSTIGIQAEDRLAVTVVDQEIHCVHGKALSIEVCIQDLPAEDLAVIQAHCGRRDDQDKWPQVTAKVRLDCLESLL